MDICPSDLGPTKDLLHFKHAVDLPSVFTCTFPEDPVNETVKCYCYPCLKSDKIISLLHRLSKYIVTELGMDGNYLNLPQ